LLDGDVLGAAAQLAAVGIEGIIRKYKLHVRAAVRALKPLSRNNQAHLKDKSSAGQSLLLVSAPIMVRLSNETGSRSISSRHWPATHVKGKIQCRSFRFGSSRKQQMISKLTDAMVSIEGENMRNVTWCVV
jgi:hypothetical protein